jgi:adenylosuccinate synthase
MQSQVAPLYKNFEGWNCDSGTIKDGKNLPAKMQHYIKFINQYIGAPVAYVSNGPQREQIIKI